MLHVKQVSSVQVWDGMDRVAPGVFANLHGASHDTGATYLGQDVKPKKPLVGGYFLSTAVATVKIITMDGDTVEILIPANLQVFVPVVIVNYNVKSAVAGKIYVYGGF